jgi:hypothetical protein
MKSYEQIGSVMQALLEAGYRLSIEIAQGERPAVGTIRIAHGGSKGLHLKFDGSGTNRAQDVVDILRRYIGDERRNVEDQSIIPITGTRIPVEYQVFRAMNPSRYYEW